MRDKLGRFKKGVYQGYGFKKGQRREKSPAWKGGQYKSHGYILILNPSHPRANCDGYVRRSYLVMEKKLKRPIKKGEVVHHKGIHFPLGSIANKQDDSPENLGLFANHSKHIKFHHSIRG